MALAQGDLVRDDGRITTFNQEVRLANSSKSAFRWVLGANYERSRTYENQFLNFADSSQNNAGANFIDAGAYTIASGSGTMLSLGTLNMT
ncbi:hypothetical protein ACFSTI_31210 [Rhizorhabdus histidinilytica]